jgi:hypothetical protein
MPSQLLTNEGITFLACKPFTYRGTEYAMGDDFPQEEANNIETLVRARFVIPVLEEGYLRPRHWHGHIRTREQAEEYLNRDRVQLRMPHEPDSDEVVNLEVLTHPETTPEPEATEEPEVEETTEEPEEDEEYDPGEHTVLEVQAYLAEHPEETEEVLARERNGRARKGILEE